MEKCRNRSCQKLIPSSDLYCPYCGVLRKVNPIVHFWASITMALAKLNEQNRGRWFMPVGIGVICILIIIIRATIVSPPTAPTANPTQPLSPSETFVSSMTLAYTSTPSLTLTSTPFPTPIATLTPTLGIGSILTHEKDGMVIVYVPEGPYNMGSDKGQPDEKPVHNVTLNPFWIDQTEVTNAMYALCVSASGCTKPDSISSSTHTFYYGDFRFSGYPVIIVDWYQAKTYCEWVGRRLPSEAEWEKAARGTDGRSYPWGDANPTKGFANYYLKDTAETGSYPEGRSLYGALDMAGNVSEWVSDWYSDHYYQEIITSNPTGPQTGNTKVVRGGSWLDGIEVLRAADRLKSIPTIKWIQVGFRCARSALNK